MDWHDTNEKVPPENTLLYVSPTDTSPYYNKIQDFWQAEYLKRRNVFRVYPPIGKDAIKWDFVDVAYRYIEKWAIVEDQCGMI